jgi:hypothetical protein
MRELKFRGLNTKGEWVYGSLVPASHSMCNVPGPKTSLWIIERAWGNGGWFNAQKRQRVRAETVGQYTGLRDKSGREIYEGDKVALDDDYDEQRWFEVYWCNQCARWRLRDKKGRYYHNLDDHSCLAVAVLGTIHENGDLL